MNLHKNLQSGNLIYWHKLVRICSDAVYGSQIETKFQRLVSGPSTIDILSSCNECILSIKGFHRMTLIESENVSYAVRILWRVSIYPSVREIFALKRIDDDKVTDGVMAVLEWSSSNFILIDRSATLELRVKKLKVSLKMDCLSLAFGNFIVIDRSATLELSLKKLKVSLKMDCLSLAFRMNNRVKRKISIKHEPIEY
ncbi:hypothetical protein WN51_06732 [Melipona quadrifasciata]|uniref:Uncharacterized protein n=1 Tax=Melipona quadrifasciata TaxID=166423 RepID=A0A0N0BCG3_9HYME|nr:hypothetical protein WN51_06732 [Melipona quadrifasciata]